MYDLMSERETTFDTLSIVKTPSRSKSLIFNFLFVFWLASLYLELSQLLKIDIAFLTSFNLHAFKHENIIQ